MDSLVVFGIAIGLSMDTFAVAVATSVALGSMTPRQVFRFAFHFGLFQALMPLLGYWAGRSIVSYVAQWDHWVAFALLAYVGGKALRESFSHDEDTIIRGDPTRGLSLITYSVATSIDALAVGLSFAMLEGSDIMLSCLIIGITCSCITLLGMLLGSRLGIVFGKRMETIGGLVLIGIGCKILLQHLLE